VVNEGGIDVVDLSNNKLVNNQSLIKDIEPYIDNKYKDSYKFTFLGVKDGKAYFLDVTYANGKYLMP
jgi:hypothetical protein